MYSAKLTLDNINTMIEKVLDGLEYRYEYSNTLHEKGYFTLDFIKPMSQGEDIEFTIIISASEVTETITVLVTDIKDLIFTYSENSFIKLNFLNSGTLYGNVFYTINDREETHVNFKHTFSIDNYENVINNIVTTIEYIDFFVLEMKNILSEDFRFE